MGYVPASPRGLAAMVSLIFYNTRRLQALISTSGDALDVKPFNVLPKFVLLIRDENGNCRFDVVVKPMDAFSS
jgi:hypothetical protein